MRREAAFAGGPLAIIAGAGRLPAEIADEVVARGEKAVVLALRGIADAELGAHPRETIDLMDPAGAVETLRRVGAAGVVLAGSVHKPRLALTQPKIVATRIPSAAAPATAATAVPATVASASGTSENEASASIASRNSAR